MNNETCKTRKQQFRRAVQLLVPGDQFIYQAAQRIPEEKLPAFPGGAALEFAVACQEPREPTSIPINPKAHHAHHDKPNLRPSPSLTGQLSLSHSIRIKSAEFWLILGEADEALRELEALSFEWVDTHNARRYGGCK